MGLIKNTLNSVGNTVKEVGNNATGGLLGAFSGVINQAMYQEYFVSGDMSGDILMKRGELMRQNGSVNTKSDANIITNGSVIDVQANQCMLIVENGRIAEACMEPGRFVYDTSIAPSFFAGEGTFGKRFVQVAKEMWEQAKVGGQRRSTQRIYFINTGVLDKSLNWGAGNIEFQHSEFLASGGAPLSVSVTLKGYGTARLRIERPLAFYENYGAKFAGGDNDAVITMDSLDENFFTTAKNKVTESIVIAITELSSKKPIRHNQIMSVENMKELRELVNAQMDNTDLERVGFDFYEFSVAGGFKLNDEDREKIANLQFRATEASNINLANYTIQSKMAEGFKAAGENGGVNGIFGMGMAMGGGLGNLGNMQQQPVQQMAAVAAPVRPVQPAQDTWTCSCGATAIGKFCHACGKPKPALQSEDTWTCTCGTVVSGQFCHECGSKKPETVIGWTCSCGHINKGKFCSNCGSKKPAAAPLYRCDKCGWEPADPKNPPKFCPECGDRFDDEDVKC